MICGTVPTLESEDLRQSSDQGTVFRSFEHKALSQSIQLVIVLLIQYKPVTRRSRTVSSEPGCMTIPRV